MNHCIHLTEPGLRVRSAPVFVPTKADESSRVRIEVAAASASYDRNASPYPVFRAACSRCGSVWIQRVPRGTSASFRGLHFVKVRTQLGQHGQWGQLVWTNRKRAVFLCYLCNFKSSIQICIGGMVSAYDIRNLITTLLLPELIPFKAIDCLSKMGILN